MFFIRFLPLTSFFLTHPRSQNRNPPTTTTKIKTPKQAWADTFISELNDTHVEAELRTKHIPPQLDSRVAASAAASCRGRRLLVLGFNATLTSSSASDAGVGVGATGVGVCDDIERIISVAGGVGGGGSGGGGQSGAMGRRRARARSDVGVV